MNKLFISPELAKILKESGFDEPCLAFKDFDYELEIGDITKNSSWSSEIVSVPLYQQVTDWLRDEHGIIIVVMPFLMQDNSITYEYTNYTDKEQDEMDHGDGPYEDYYDALNAAIKSALSCI
jgi:hypothetical protein